MTPWPTADVQSSSPFGFSPTTSPMQQPDNQDPFAAYGAGPGAPQFNQAPAPAQQQHAPTMAPPQPAVVQQQQTQAELTPPPAVVDCAANQEPPSPMGDVSVMAAANNANATTAPGPAMPNGMQQWSAQPLQPSPAQAPTQAPPAPAAPANPFDFGNVASSMPPASAMAPPPAQAPPQAPPTPPQVAEAAAQQQQQQQQQQAFSPPTSPVPPGSFAPNQQFADPFGYAFSPMTSPVTSPNGSPGDNQQALVPSANANPFAPPPFMPGTQAPPATQAVVPSTAPNADPFGVFGSGQPAPAPANVDPFGGGALVTSAQPAPAASATSDDPFGIFGAPTPVAAPAPVTQAPPAQQQQQASVPTTQDDPWAAAGFNDMVSQQPPTTTTQSHQPPPPAQQNNTSSSYTPSNDAKQEDKPITLDSNNLPSEGEYYEARINARSLGAMFYTARNLEEKLYSKMPHNVIEALGSRPVVAYVAENSAAYNSGVMLGHVVLSVNGHEVNDPEYCASTIRNSPRPMTLRCYVPPDMELTLNEGKHLVKYDTKDLEAPVGNSMEWKKKYVVVGGIVTKPWMMNMFYKKVREFQVLFRADYDIAVKEAHAGRKISVKVKQFDLRGARIILKGRDGKPNWVEYPNERKPWYYITILPNKGYPIKISSESLDELEPVYSAVRRFIRKDMEARYQYRMDESFGNDSLSAKATSTRSNGGSSGSGRSKSQGFDQFGDTKTDSYWN
ncbi:hypothetical protein ACHAXR_009996 [Thalassiosira sp. AJA248-18]